MTSKSENINSSGCSDEQLVISAQNGEHFAVDKLLTRYRPFVISLAAHYFGASLETDDIVQEGLIGLLSAIYSFSTGKNAAFRTYCAACINNAMRSAIRSNTGRKNLPLNSYISIDDIELISEESPEDKYIYDEKIAFVDSFMNTELSELEKKVLSFHIAGYDYKTIASFTEINEKSVDNALQRVRKKLKNALNDN